MQTLFSYKKLIFSYINKQDLLDITNMLAKESVCRYMLFGPNTEDESKAYFLPLIEEIQESLTNHKLPLSHVFTIKENDQFIGQCALLPIAFSKDNYLIGYQIDEPFWGRGVGMIAGEFLLHYGFNVLHAHRITGDCLSNNLGSKRIMEKLGFEQEGMLKQYYFKNNCFYDNLLYAIFNNNQSGI
ncbi:MAG: GNAT family N-acetyltransferase [Brevinema sp.]